MLKMNIFLFSISYLIAGIFDRYSNKNLLKKTSKYLFHL